MNKRKVVVLAGLLIFSLLGWMGYSSVQTLKENKEKNALTNSLSTMFKSLEIEAEVSNENTLLIYFNSECENCQWEIKELSRNIDKFNNTNLAFVSLEPADNAKQFLKNHSLHQFYINVKPENIMNTFSGVVPQIFIYKGNDLKEKFKGEVKTEVLLKALNN